MKPPTPLFPIAMLDEQARRPEWVLTLDYRDLRRLEAMPAHRYLRLFLASAEPHCPIASHDETPVEVEVNGDRYRCATCCLVGNVWSAAAWASGHGHVDNLGVREFVRAALSRSALAAAA